MSNKDVIVVSEDGTSMAIYSDERIDMFKEVGDVSIKKVSDVEWENGGWSVRSTHDPELAIRLNSQNQQVVSREGSLVIFPKRAEALDKEVELFWELIP